MVGRGWQGLGGSGMGLEEARRIWYQQARPHGEQGALGWFRLPLTVVP